MFVDNSTIHNIYINNGSFDFIFNLPYILYATIIIYVLKFAFYYFITIHKESIQIKNNTLGSLSAETNKIIHKIIIRIFLFFSICISLLIIFGLYIACFTAILPKIKLHLFIRAAISLSISLIIPLFLHFITACIRIFSLSNTDKSRKYLYKMSQILQLL